MAVITLTDKCPECQQPLMEDLGVEGYFCDNGHKFATLPEQALETAVVPESSDFFSAPVSEVPAVQDLHEPQAEVAPQADEPGPIAPQVSEEAPAADLAAEFADVQPAASFEPEPEKASAAMVEGTIVEDGADLLMVIRIPDEHWKKLKNRAEECGTDLYSHFKERLDFGLQCDWYD